MKRHLPLGDYGLRVLTSALMLLASYMLLAGSTFALRMRNDMPALVPGLDGPQSIALLVSVALAIQPLLWGPRYLTGLVVSAALATCIGAYWWTTIPWDELITKSQFPTTEPPVLMDYVRVACPAILVAFYAATSRASAMRADYRTRGADADEAARAAAASFLSGAGGLLVAGALAAGLWVALAQGWLRVAPPVRGVPALVLAAALLAVAYALTSVRFKLPKRAPRPPAAPAEPKAGSRGAEPG